MHINRPFFCLYILAFVVFFFVSVTHGYELTLSEDSSEVLSSDIFEEVSSIDISPLEASNQLKESLQSQSLSSSVSLSAAGFAYARENIFDGTFSQTQVDNINSIIAACNKYGVTDIRQVAYIFATAVHETAHTMRPVSMFVK